ncbi:hypothetical protein UCRPC4_g03336 [Phaeomoniella chlamydospora]|uniref:Pyruvate carboxyltransferase domain-containing protein n=1 Tax=Phaeomoniella chlamydospora TaxID=158046 RepID=A0A0G2EID1_PHACM|nr:hypothetical protein UCRPC4_g03336 [Phaeomoniella chlamydospora]
MTASLLEMGCDEVSVADTTGMGTAPRTRKLLQTLSSAGILNEDLALHFHDTYGQALVNTMVGLEHGIRTFDSSVGGLGGCPYSKGATGNVATEDMVHMLHSLGLQTGIDLEKMAEIESTYEISKYLDLLPRACPGCGALTHDDPKNKAGFYGRKHIRKTARKVAKNEGIPEAPVSVDESEKEKEDLCDEGEERKSNTSNNEKSKLEDAEKLSQAVCDRCHDLAKESIGKSILHPSIASIAATIDESPFRRNHVYHVLDAADFPASLIPSVFDELDLVQQRSQNRRAKSTMYKGGRTTTVSFLITRSDILLPSQEQVDKLMPHIVDILRQALGRQSQGARLGNVHLVSSKRGWWTKELKEEIQRRGGANWMVGKVNVGKSNLFEVVYPKGNGNAEPDFDQLKEEANRLGNEISSLLLPPSQELVPYPTLPLVSSLPGTTASPIRVPFAASTGKRGELIDLPGLFRSPLEAFVKPEHQTDLVMTKRPKPDQISIKMNQSLLLGGGLVRITPYSPSEATPEPDSKEPPTSNPDISDSSPPINDLVFLAHPFLPHTVSSHLTSTTKAIEIQSGTLSSGINSLLSPDAAGPHMCSAGIFTLDKDVTKTYASKLLEGRSRQDRKKVSDLPFRIFAKDIIIEGIGWVEITCAVRLKRNTTNTRPSDTESHSPDFSITPTMENQTDPFLTIPRPQIQVFTPHGKGIAERESLGIYNQIVSHVRQRKKGPEKSLRFWKKGR